MVSRVFWTRKKTATRPRQLLPATIQISLHLQALKRRSPQTLLPVKKSWPSSLLPAKIISILHLLPARRTLFQLLARRMSVLQCLLPFRTRFLLHLSNRIRSPQRHYRRRLPLLPLRILFRWHLLPAPALKLSEGR